MMLHGSHLMAAIMAGHDSSRLRPDASGFFIRRPWQASGYDCSRDRGGMRNVWGRERPAPLTSGYLVNIACKAGCLSTTIPLAH